MDESIIYNGRRLTRCSSTTDAAYFNTSLEAKVEQSRSRPIHGKPFDLKHLLECKANTNESLKPRDISPLRQEMRFAQRKYATQMWDLLLHYAANEIDKDQKGGSCVNVLMEVTWNFEGGAKSSVHA